jgi:hypothetical protein
MASIRNVRLISSKLNGVQFWARRIGKTAGIEATVDRLVTARASSSMETSAASSLLEGKRYGIEAG